MPCENARHAAPDHGHVVHVGGAHRAPPTRSTRGALPHRPIARAIVCISIFFRCVRVTTALLQDLRASRSVSRIDPRCDRRLRSISDAAPDSTSCRSDVDPCPAGSSRISRHIDECRPSQAHSDPHRMTARRRQTKAVRPPVGPRKKCLHSVKDGCNLRAHRSTYCVNTLFFRPSVSVRVHRALR